jgi:hypothetical protein
MQKNSEKCREIEKILINSVNYEKNLKIHTLQKNAEKFRKIRKNSKFN